MSSSIDVELLEPNKWNPNVMQDAEYQALKEDMRLRGPRGIDPVLVSIKNIFYSKGPVSSSQYSGKGYVIIDGEHRWKAAKELAWKQVLCTVESIQEDEAKGICYRKNRERGTIDPFKEAALFNSELSESLNQKDIAKKYLVDASTVSHRLSLLRLQPKIIESVRKMPRGTITPSHLEPIATLEPEDQKKVDFKWPYGERGIKTVKQIEDEVNNLKEERAEQKALAEALQTAKFPKCPKCQGTATQIHYKKLPWVQCDRGHEWSLNTGKPLWEPIHVGQNSLDGKTEVRVSSVLRSAHTVKDLASVFGDRVKELVPKMDGFSSIRISGMLEGARFSYDLHFYGHSMGVYVSWGGRDEGFNAEEHDYRSGEKSAVHCGNPESIEAVKAFIEAAFQGKLGIEPKKRKKEASS